MIRNSRFTGSLKRSWGSGEKNERLEKGRAWPADEESSLRVLRLHPPELDDKYHSPQRRHPPWHKEEKAGKQSRASGGK